jgi:antitoxin PrlF
MSSAIVSSKGQITIPSDVREEFGIEPGHRIVFFKRLDGQLGFRLIKQAIGSGYGVLSKPRGGEPADLSRDAIGEAVAQGVAERLEQRRSAA